MKKLTINWQRLVDAGKTCPRCGDTGEEVRKAAATLSGALAALGMEVQLTEGQLSADEFGRAPLESNRILIQGRTLEAWLGAETGQSPCCEVCGPNDCRTVTVEGATYESIPADLIVRAGLLAAAEMLAEPDEKPQPCCGPTVPVQSTIPVRGSTEAAESLLLSPPGQGCCG